MKQRRRRKIVAGTDPLRTAGVVTATAPARIKQADRRTVVAALGLLAFSLLAYSDSFAGSFVLDNRGLLLLDPRLREVSLTNLGRILAHTYWWPTGEGGVYRPFATLTYLFNYSILGNAAHPAGYHWVNFLLHAVNVLLVYALARRLIQGFGPPLFIAALWAVHPLLTECVTNMVGRPDLLAAGCVLGAMLIYLKYLEVEGEAERSARMGWLAALILVTAAGVFSKENAVVIPAEIVAWELIFRTGRRWRKAQFQALAAVVAPIALMFWARAAVLASSLPKEVPFTDNPIVGADFWTGRFTAIHVLARYLALIFWPAQLSADYSWSQIPLAHGAWQVWLACTAVLAVAPAAYYLYRWNRGVFFLLCFGAIWLAPVSNLAFPIGTIMAERFLYLPCIGVAACVVAGIWSIARRAGNVNYALVVLSAAGCALAARTWIRNADWKDDLTIAKASVEAAPNSFKTHDLLANVLFASDPSHSDIDRVVSESRKTLAILDPLPDDRNFADPYKFAAVCDISQGELLAAHSQPGGGLESYKHAIGALRRFLSIENVQYAIFKRELAERGKSTAPTDAIANRRKAEAWSLLSTAYLRAGDLTAASAAAMAYRDLAPLEPNAYRQIADVAIAAGRLDDAAVTLVQGAFTGSDPGLRQKLVELYRTALPPGNCSLIPGPNGPAINPRCEIVHRHLCAAAPGTVNTLLAAGQSANAQARKKMFTEEFGCPNE